MFFNISFNICFKLYTHITIYLINHECNCKLQYSPRSLVNIVIDFIAESTQ